MPGKRQPELPTRHVDDLLKGTKYAYLELDDDGKPWFRGTAGYSGYRTEEYAVCGANLNKAEHVSPDLHCSCGFYIPSDERGRITRPQGSVALEVEMAGKIIRFEHGYRAQWQRVLSVTLPTECGQGNSYAKNSCAGPARWLCTIPNASTYSIGGNDGKRLGVCCAVHMRRSKHVIGKPVSWLRQELQTEIRPGNVRDELPLDEAARLAAVDEVAREQYPVREILDVVAMPVNPRQGDFFRVMIDVRSKMQYEFVFMGTVGWQVNAIYHPMLEPWGWGTPQ